MDMYMYVYMYACRQVCVYMMYEHACMHMYVCLHACMHLFTYVRVCISVYMYICINNLL